MGSILAFLLLWHAIYGFTHLLVLEVVPAVGDCVEVKYVAYDARLRCLLGDDAEAAELVSSWSAEAGPLDIWQSRSFLVPTCRGVINKVVVYVVALDLLESDGWKNVAFVRIFDSSYPVVRVVQVDFTS